LPLEIKMNSRNSSVEGILQEGSNSKIGKINACDQMIVRRQLMIEEKMSKPNFLSSDPR
jgi:hypothetical protein